MSNDLEPLSPQEEIVLFEKDNPRALVNLVPPTVAEAIGDHLFQHPDLFDKDETALKSHIRQAHNHNLTPLDHRLRLKFWMEYDQSQVNHSRGIEVSRVIAGLCSRELFYKQYLKNPLKVAWLLCPPTGYMVKAEEALEYSIDQLREMLELPHKDPLTGKPNPAMVKIKVTIFEMLHTIVKGAPVQRTMNVHAHTANQKVVAAATASSMEDLKKKLRELELLNRKAQNLPLASPDAHVPDPT